MSNGEIILYTTADGLTKIQLKAQDGTVWLTQDDIANLFQKARSTISEHIQHIFNEHELDPNSVCRNFRRTASDQKTYEIQHYNLDLILSVGYRVKSPRGTQFRQWATTILREYLVKGFTMDDARLKDPIGWDYFDELLERIREIRASEKRFYQKIKDIYTLSVDYQSNAKETQIFFQTVQNKMLWSVTRKTAAELLIERSDPTLPNMGLTSWKGSRVRKGDVGTAKNYLTHEEIEELNRIVTMFIDYAEDQTKKRKAIYMRDWDDRVNAFLEFHDRPVLNHAGEISHEKAEETVHKRYEQFALNRGKKELLESENEVIEDLLNIERHICDFKESNTGAKN
jgi:hypothetical protein